MKNSNNNNNTDNDAIYTNLNTSTPSSATILTNDDILSCNNYSEFSLSSDLSTSSNSDLGKKNILHKRKKFKRNMSKNKLISKQSTNLVQLENNTTTDITGKDHPQTN